MELARWIGSPSNPLTARVMVNRVWQHHFGEGIVRTPSNFGKLGEGPTHPELLDFLADRFVRSGWSIKALHRAIMLSATYQQASVPSASALQTDPDNRLLGRMNRRRLEAEEIRDSLLQASNRLEPFASGPATQDFNKPCRTVYLMTIRSDRSSFRELFDAADPTAIADRRVISTVAPQALFMLNNAFVLEQARRLSERIQKTGPTGLSGKIQTLYQLLLGRPALPEEEAIAREFITSSSEKAGRHQEWEKYCQVLLCTNEFVYVD